MCMQIQTTWLHRAVGRTTTASTDFTYVCAAARCALHPCRLCTQVIRWKGSDTTLLWCLWQQPRPRQPKASASPWQILCSPIRPWLMG